MDALENQKTEIIAKSWNFWDDRNLLLAHIALIALVIFGFQANFAYHTLDTFGGFTLSGPGIVFAVTALLWFLVIGSFLVSFLKTTKWGDILPIITTFGSWLVVLLLSWFLFIALLEGYILFNLTFV